MKLQNRILLASGFYRYGGTVLFIWLGYAIHPAAITVAIGWLIYGRRPVRQLLLPPLFPVAHCGNTTCRAVIPLRDRWHCKVGEWTDQQVRHALAVYSDQGHEVRSFHCPECEATIPLQKGDRDLYKQWKPLQEYGTSQPHPVPSGWKRRKTPSGLLFGHNLQSFPPLSIRVWRWLRGQPIHDPLYLNDDLLSQHGTIFGATGVGKSSQIVNIARELFERGEGGTFLDPTGDLARDLLKYVPSKRVSDVIYINASDKECPSPFNILYAKDDVERSLLVDEVLTIFKTISGTSWSVHIERILRMAILAVMEFNGSFRDVYDMIGNPEQRQRMVRRIKNKELRRYWNEQFEGTSLTQRVSLIAKLETIINHKFLGPILGSRHCCFDADEVIKEKKILIVNLATGTPAPYVIEMLGTLIVNKIRAAAYRQFHIEDKSKRVRHFFVVDEFQNFMDKASGWTRSLSEVRKFNLCLLLATQYVGQVSEDIRQAIFGNVGYLVAFRVGNDDSGKLKDEFDAKNKKKLMKLQRRECLIRFNGNTTKVFTPELREPSKEDDPTDKIIKLNRDRIKAMREDEPDFRLTENTAIQTGDRTHLHDHDAMEPEDDREIEVETEDLVLIDYA